MFNSGQEERGEASSGGQVVGLQWDCNGIRPGQNECLMTGVALVP